MRIYRKTTNLWRHPSRQFIWIGIECFQVEQTASLKCQNFNTRNGLAFWKQYAICHGANWAFIWWKSYGERQRILNLHESTHWQLQSSNRRISHAFYVLVYMCESVQQMKIIILSTFKFYGSYCAIQFYLAQTFVVVIRERFWNKLL